MDFLLTLQNVTVLFSLIIVGFLVGRTNIVTVNGQKELSNLVLRVTMPATIILALQLEYTKERFNTALKIMLIVGLAYLMMIILSMVFSKFFKLEDNQRDIVQIATILPNTSFMGYPIVLSILGKEALFFAVLGAGLIFEIVSWTYGIYVIGRSTEKKDNSSALKNILLSPGILSIIIGFSLFILSIRIPEPLNTTMSILGQATSPLAMLVVGIILSRSDIKECLVSFRLYIISAIRLLVFPLIILFSLKALGFTGMEIVIPTVMLGMPTAAYVAMFSANAGNDSKLASQIVFICSLMSLITIPFIVTLLG